MCPGLRTESALSMFICIVTSISKCFLRRQTVLFYSWQEALLMCYLATTKTWTNTCSLKGFEILVFARVVRQRCFCQMHWATSSVLFFLFFRACYWLSYMYIRLFNCSVDMLSANWWMILHFTELKCEPLPYPYFTKPYVYSFYTKALIFVIKRCEYPYQHGRS